MCLCVYLCVLVCACLWTLDFPHFIACKINVLLRKKAQCMPHKGHLVRCKSTAQVEATGVIAACACCCRYLFVVYACRIFASTTTAIVISIHHRKSANKQFVAVCHSLHTAAACTSLIHQPADCACRAFKLCVNIENS